MKLNEQWMQKTIVVWIGALLWVGFTAAGLAWCIQYERTEPLDRP